MHPVLQLPFAGAGATGQGGVNVVAFNTQVRVKGRRGVRRQCLVASCHGTHCVGTATVMSNTHRFAVLARYAGAQHACSGSK